MPVRRSTHLRPGCGEPFGARPLEAGGAALRLVGVCTTAAWKLLEHTPFQPNAHHLTVPHAAPACSVALRRTNKKEKLDFAGLKQTILPPKKRSKDDVFKNVYLLPFLFDPVGGAVSVATGVDGQRAQ